MTLEHYALVPPISEFALSQGVNNTTVGVRSGCGEYVLKHFQAAVGIEGYRYELDLLRWLASQSLSFSVPVPIATSDGRSFVQDAEGFHLLMPLLLGRCSDGNDPIQIEAMGAALGELHSALEAYPTTPRPNVVAFDDLCSIHPLVPHPRLLSPSEAGWPNTRENDRLCGWWREEVASLDAFLADTYPNLPAQVIHGDMAPSNTLYHNKRIAAILDFEFSGPDARIIDIASSLKFSMRIWENHHPWQIAAHFCRGYQDRIELLDIECASLVDTMILRDVVSTIWWIGRGLADNRVPDTYRLSELRDFKTWLAKHRSQLEDLWLDHPIS